MTGCGRFRSLADQEGRAAHDRFQTTALNARRQLASRSESKKPLTPLRIKGLAVLVAWGSR